ncbi:MAG: hypothetical protein ACRD2S_01390, partial [Terriglobales bacterium]
MMSRFSSERFTRLRPFPATKIIICALLVIIISSLATFSQTVQSFQPQIAPPKSKTTAPPTDPSTPQEPTPQPPAELPQLVDITASTGIKFEHLSSPEQKFIVESMSGGVALID